MTPEGLKEIRLYACGNGCVYRELLDEVDRLRAVLKCAQQRLDDFGSNRIRKRIEAVIDRDCRAPNVFRAGFRLGVDAAMAEARTALSSGGGSP